MDKRVVCLALLSSMSVLAQEPPASVPPTADTVWVSPATFEEDFQDTGNQAAKELASVVFSSSPRRCDQGRTEAMACGHIDDQFPMPTALGSGVLRLAGSSRSLAKRADSLDSRQGVSN